MRDAYVKFTDEFGDDDGFRARYRGRFYYDGPALDIDTNELQSVIKRSPVELQWDQMGLGLVVYPK